ncbi:MAG: cupin domain-containing protein [Rhodospirillales bacterium]|nr:cupin domain-containing protein [Rhodospirillales bacterium]
MNSSAPHIINPAKVSDLKDWGVQPDMVEGQSHSSGVLLWKSADRKSESGLWVCTPGTWKLSLPSDELCHFIDGHATYTSDDGEVIDVTSGTVVHFKEGWAGQCVVHETLRNVYMLR